MLARSRLVGKNTSRHHLRPFGLFSHKCKTMHCCFAIFLGSPMSAIQPVWSNGYLEGVGACAAKPLAYALKGTTVNGHNVDVGEQNTSTRSVCSFPSFNSIAISVLISLCHFSFSFANHLPLAGDSISVGSGAASPVSYCPLASFQ